MAIEMIIALRKGDMLGRGLTLQITAHLKAK
jgi:hypothetical protein